MILSSCLAGWIVLAAAAPASLPSATETLSLDSANSSAAFSVKVLWMFGVDGQFGSLHGQVAIDHSSGQATVDARIDANDVSMRRESALDWVKSAEFFDVAHYPEIRFRSDAFPLARLHDGGELPGSLTMRGITQPVLFDILPASCKRAAIDCPVEAAGTVRRSEFGMRTRRATLSDKVELGFSIRMSEPAPDLVE
jgi:polyisoprenoid-binding protein YceI